VWRELELDDARESLVPEEEAEESHGVTVVVVVPFTCASVSGVLMATATKTKLALIADV